MVMKIIGAVIFYGTYLLVLLTIILVLHKIIAEVGIKGIVGGIILIVITVVVVVLYTLKKMIDAYSDHYKNL